MTPRRSPPRNRALRSHKSLSHRAGVSALRTLAALFCAQDEGDTATSRSAGDAKALRDVIIVARKAEDVANTLRGGNRTQITEIYEIIQREGKI